MELYQIKTFLAVVEESSVTKAAKRLYTTPPSVSAHIKALEEELEVTLFVRSTKGMKLTAEGTAIRDKAERLLAAALDIATEAASLRGHVSGGLEIGLNSDPRFLRASQIAATLRKQHPNLELNFLESDSNRIIDAIRTDNLDAGFLYAQIDLRDFELLPVKQTELAIVIPSIWKSKIPDGNWEAVAAHPWIYTTCYCAFHTQIEEAFKQRELTFHSHVKTDGDTMRCELVAEGMGIAIMERERAQKLVAADKAFIWNSDTALFCDLQFGYLKRRASDPAIKAAIDIVKEIWQKKTE